MKTSSLTKSFLALFLLSVSTTSAAQNNVVVIPFAGDDAAPGLAGFAGGDQDIQLTSSTQVVRSVTMTFPGAGKAIVNVSGYTYTNSTTDPYTATCFNTDLTVGDNDAFIWTRLDPSDGGGFTGAPFASTRGYDVVAGDSTFNLICRATEGTDVHVADTHLTFMFFPESQ